MDRSAGTACGYIMLCIAGNFRGQADLRENFPHKNTYWNAILQKMKSRNFYSQKSPFSSRQHFLPHENYLLSTVRKVKDVNNCCLYTHSGVTIGTVGILKLSPS